MKNWKHTIWRVPLISVITGFLWTPCMVRLLVHFAIVRQPDGSLDFNESRQLLIYGLGMAAVLVLGGLLLLRKLTRREIFISASLVVGYCVLLNVAQLVTGITTGPGVLVFIRLSAPLEWTHFPDMLLRMVLPEPDVVSTAYIYLTSLPSLFVPYLFALFGRKRTSSPPPSGENPAICA